MTPRISCFGLAACGLASLVLTTVTPCAVRGEPARVSGSLFAAAFISDTACIMVGDRGKIYLSGDGAKSWEAVDGGTKYALSSVCFTDDRNGWIAGQAGTLLHSRDGGTTWEAQSSGVDAHLLHVDFLDPLHGIAVGASTVVLTTADGGRTWDRSPLKATAGLFDDLNLFAGVMLDDRNACVVGDMGRIFISEDGGRAWSETRTPLYDEQAMMGRVLYSVAYDAGVLYAAGIDSTLAYSRDRGRSWTQVDTGFSKPDLYWIDMVEGTGLAAGSGGHLIRTSDGGATWRAVDVPEEITRSWLSGLALRKDRSGRIEGLVVGQRGTYGSFSDGVVTWQGGSAEREGTER